MFRYLDLSYIALEGITYVGDDEFNDSLAAIIDQRKKVVELCKLLTSQIESLSRPQQQLKLPASKSREIVKYCSVLEVSIEKLLTGTANNPRYLKQVMEEMNGKIGRAHV